MDGVVPGAGEAGAEGFASVRFDGAAVVGGECFEQLRAALGAFDAPAAAVDGHEVDFAEAGRQPGRVADVVGVDAAFPEAGGEEDFGCGGGDEDGLGGTVEGVEAEEAGAELGAPGEVIVCRLLEPGFEPGEVDAAGPGGDVGGELGEPLALVVFDGGERLGDGDGGFEGLLVPWRRNL